jgi:hypothetical protein
MGRKKIKIEKINNNRTRLVTLYKRIKGLLKKAMELSVLCNVDVMLYTLDKSSGKCLFYCSKDNIFSFLNELPRFLQNRKIITNQDFDKIFNPSNREESLDYYSKLVKNKRGRPKEKRQKNNKEKTNELPDNNDIGYMNENDKNDNDNDNSDAEDECSYSSAVFSEFNDFMKSNNANTLNINNKYNDNNFNDNEYNNNCNISNEDNNTLTLNDNCFMEKESLGSICGKITNASTSILHSNHNFSYNHKRKIKEMKEIQDLYKLTKLAMSWTCCSTESFSIFGKESGSCCINCNQDYFRDYYDKIINNIDNMYGDNHSNYNLNMNIEGNLNSNINSSTKDVTMNNNNSTTNNDNTITINTNTKNNNYNSPTISNRDNIINSNNFNNKNDTKKSFKTNSSSIFSKSDESPMCKFFKNSKKDSFKDFVNKKSLAVDVNMNNRLKDEEYLNLKTKNLTYNNKESQEKCLNLNCQNKISPIINVKANHFIFNETTLNNFNGLKDYNFFFSDKTNYFCSETPNNKNLFVIPEIVEKQKNEVRNKDEDSRLISFSVENVATSNSDSNENNRKSFRIKSVLANKSINLIKNNTKRNRKKLGFFNNNKSEYNDHNKQDIEGSGNISLNNIIRIPNIKVLEQVKPDMNILTRSKNQKINKPEILEPEHSEITYKPGFFRIKLDSPSNKERFKK